MNNNFPYAVVIIKPDAHRDILSEMIVKDFEEGGFAVVFRKDIVLSQVQAEQIYSKEHNQPTFNDATRSLLGTNKDKFSTLIILKTADNNNGLLRAREVKGKVGLGGIR